MVRLRIAKIIQHCLQFWYILRERLSTIYLIASSPKIVAATFFDNSSSIILNLQWKIKRSLLLLSYGDAIWAIFFATLQFCCEISCTRKFLKYSHQNAFFSMCCGIAARSRIDIYFSQRLRQQIREAAWCDVSKIFFEKMQRCVAAIVRSRIDRVLSLATIAATLKCKAFLSVTAPLEKIGSKQK